MASNDHVAETFGFSIAAVREHANSIAPLSRKLQYLKDVEHQFRLSPLFERMLHLQRLEKTSPQTAQMFYRFWHSSFGEEIRHEIEYIESTMRLQSNEAQRDSRHGEKRKVPSIVSSDTDGVRILEAMKEAGIIAGNGTDMTGAFRWKGKLNELPRNYGPTKAQLASTSLSDEIVKMIELLLSSAGPDVLTRIMQFCKKPRPH